jgi:hypothetical protein
MERKFPKIFLSLLINWLPFDQTCVEWDGLLADFFRLDVGLRQGSILAPFCFAICINDIIKLCLKCHLGDILVYSDNILIIARSITGSQKIITIIGNYLNWLHLSINCAKSCCMRIGKRFNCAFANIISRAGSVILWVNKMGYLGVYFVASCKFKCSFT